MRYSASTTLVLLLAGFANSGNAKPTLAAAGALDPSFGTAGKVTLDVFSGSERAAAVAIQADGKIVTVGGGSDFGVLRFDQRGGLDPSFDGDGKVFTDFGGSDFATCVATQANGKIVVGGGSVCLYGALARYNPDGSLDTSFDGDGKVVVDLDPQGCEHVADLALRPDGKIVTFGTMGTFTFDWVVARFNPDGSLDASFGTGGKTTTDFGDYQDADAMAIQEDGKIVVVGYGAGQVLMARYTSEGHPDPSFDVDGKLTFNWEGFGRGTDVALQSDGKIVVAGEGTLGSRCAVARLNPDGTFDPSFDEDGKVVTFLEGSPGISSVALQSDGKVVVGGWLNHDFDESFLLVRYDTEGALDETFGSAGIVTTDFGRPEDVGVLCPPSRPDCSNDLLWDLVIDADGRIITAGGAGPCAPQCLTALARYEGIGSDDTPPTLTLAATPSVLWPPNHQMVAVHVGVTASDDVDPSPDVDLISVTSDEPNPGVPGDIETVTDNDFLLRAERDGSGDGREYLICYRATDDAGNATEACAVVTVPRDRSARAELAPGELVVYGSPLLSIRSMTPGSLRLRMADGTLVEPHSIGYEDRDRDSFEDALFFPAPMEYGSVELPSSPSAPQGLYARWDANGASYLATLGAPVGVGTSAAFRLSAVVVPNPVREVAAIQYYLPRDARVRLGVYDVAGREQARLVDGFLPAGRHQARWRIPRGGGQVYWYRLEALGESVRGRFVVRN